MKTHVRTSAYGLSGSSLVLLIVLLGEASYVLFVSNPLGTIWLTASITSLPFKIGLLYAGYWLPDSSLSPDRYPSIYYWVGGGVLISMLINIGLMIGLPPDGWFHLLSWVRWGVSLGAGSGLVVGLFQARRIDRAIDAERSRIRAREAEDKKQLLSYLNTLLRHEVLNAAHAIQGTAHLVTSEYPDDETISDRMDSIVAETEDMEAVINDVRAFLSASKGGGEFECTPIDITAVLTDEVDNIRARNESVTIEKTMPSEAVVSATPVIRRAFSNLLSNAVKHNDSGTPRITISVEKKEDTVVVKIADNGPGIPPARRNELFERNIEDDYSHGLGLLLAATLIEAFDGTIELTETGTDGTEFTIELPRISDDTGDHGTTTSDE
ncbi:MAG: HAMP domain-containing sensor histidine kinase [Natronomonas sp.]